MTTGPDDTDLPRDAAGMTAFLEGLRFSDDPVDADLPAIGDDEPLVVRSLRLPVAMETRIRAIATAQGVPVTVLTREWIVAGLAVAEESAQVNPVTELIRIITEAQRVTNVIAHRRAAT
jgi:hypothetical protein